MIKSTIRAGTYRAMYRLLDRVSPLEFDCGLLCGAACCRDVQQEDDEEMGMSLLPGEDKIHDRKDGWLAWHEDSTEDLDYPDSWNGKVFFVRCGGPEHCRRTMRPIQCRTFPLAPHLNGPSDLVMILNDMVLPYECPLTDPEMAMALGRPFVRATYTVWKRLLSDPLIYDLVEADSLEREAVTVVFDPEERYLPGYLLLNKR
ncbi:MAG: hypothetical protein IKD85_00930 [Firmicutes bacterium]|nr:hypothetical protein [Bacillota bacterium]